MKNIAFIINPIAGTVNKRRIPKLIEKHIDKDIWSFDIVFSEYKGHAIELARHYAALGFSAVVAVGGDGTVNEVASGLRGTNTALGIIPIGSGNGFARHLGTPLRIPGAIEALNSATPQRCDYGLANDHPFFATCGTGFDATISELFQKAGSRGFRTYVEQSIKLLFNYQPQHYELRFPDNSEPLTGEAFLITFANCNQWGAAAFIAPKASIQDGLLDIVVCSPFPLYQAPGLALKLFNKTIDQGMNVSTIKAREVTLVRESPAPFHLDGDPVHFPGDIHIRIVEDGLWVLTPKKY
ncbi:MAG: diacylglycerol kinase family lipid kinase [Paludibacteraceae bacterium]|nr:diacylglycerol kinase family lipid kinase [Paludibacteraceae bacterium]